MNGDFEVINSPNAIISKLDEGVVATILALKQGNGYRHSKIHLYYLDGESNQYLSIEKVIIEDRGKGNKKRTPIVENYTISNSIANELNTNFRMTQEKVNVI